MPTDRLSLKEAAAGLRVTPSNLRHAIRRGSLRAEKIGRDWFVAPAEVVRYSVEVQKERN